MLILLLILFIVLVLLILPLGIKISYDGKLKIGFSYLFFSFFLSQKKQKENKEKIKEKTTSTAFDEFKKTLKKQNKMEILKLLKKIIEILIKNLKILWNHLAIKKFFVDLRIADEDAFKTATVYGNACSLVYPVASFLKNNKNIKNIQTNVYPDFNEKNTKIKLEIEISIKIIFLLIQIIGLLADFIKIKKLKGMV